MIATDIHISGYEQASYSRNEWVIRPTPGTPLEAVIDPTYWKHHGGRLRVGDRIEVVAQDGAYDADLRVYAVERLYAKVRVLRLWRSESVAIMTPAETEAAPDVLDGIAVSFAKAHKWRIMDTDTGEVIEKMFSTKDDALDARDKYLAKRAA